MAIAVIGFRSDDRQDTARCVPTLWIFWMDRSASLDRIIVAIGIIETIGAIEAIAIFLFFLFFLFFFFFPE